MGILLAFAPFIAFAVVDRLVGPTEGLMAGALVSFLLVARDVFMAGRSPKILETGTAVLFCALAAYALLANPTWSVIGVRLCVDAGLLLIVLATMVIGRPFTLQYAREQIGAEHHADPAFLRTNYVISGAWALAFGIMVAAELAPLVFAEHVASSWRNRDRRGACRRREVHGLVPGPREGLCGLDQIPAPLANPVCPAYEEAPSPGDSASGDLGVGRAQRKRASPAQSLFSITSDAALSHPFLKVIPTCGKSSFRI